MTLYQDVSDDANTHPTYVYILLKITTPAITK
ncbi:hypothetical protein EC843_104221 [Buttiauxella sp. JUb87]|jgi:hypothetical protein|nr:hypothetical protein EC843_104221 [Buttiauxella sp. JUb87]